MTKTITMSRRQWLAFSGAAAASLALGPIANAATRHRKIVIRVDDVGHSPVHNIGTFEAIDGGMVTSVDIMLDSPGTVDALERLKAYPWLSLGWHVHMWGAPILPASRVPSLVDKGGEFDGRFRTDLARASDVVAEEAVAELRAQLQRCQRILGRVPDTGKLADNGTPWGRAMNAVNAEAGIVSGYATVQPTGAKVLAKIRAAQAKGEEWAKYYNAKGAPEVPAQPQWAHAKILQLDGTEAYIDVLTDSETELELHYDPVLYYTQDRAGILTLPEDVIAVQAWHPGYVDYYVYRQGERANRARARQFTVNRTQDVAALRDPRLKDWIRRNGIELVNQRDALFGSREFQNHLRAIGSDLAIG
ncbi:ChbG/HpnK family deacetylase [Novosphingobium umbonatum]|uniref:ChbG/HpnK family deacetylase n=1 Tax=Novosphingobium umbonatum TaxID=1908524 RepID=A0A3S2UP29_9SPHN|nr:ChbG/HpnK family deacetylase [Novosphingobium umbonatum]RVU03218.1 ChbG/HpnK family deacetylase [Novosphingobium umbonatum]